MRVITCASYYGTGSSAVTDFFSEFEDICSLGDYEYRFLQDPGGIADLEYHVVENNHRHNTSDAIKNYQKFCRAQMKMGYGGYDIFEGKFMEYSEEFLQEITELKTHTWWNKDRLDRGPVFQFCDRVYSKVKCLLTGTLGTEVRYSMLTKKEYGYYTAISEERFLQAVKSYVNRLLTVVNKKNMPYVMVDQMVPPTHLQRYIRYFDDVKIIVVDRDPRDVFLLEKERWRWGVIPVKDVKEYVQWFRITRAYAKAKEDETKVLRICFEDMIYHYEETTKKLMDFVGISEEKHVKQKKYFAPEKSIHNTNLKHVISGYEEEIKYIEKELSEYLYDFENN